MKKRVLAKIIICVLIISIIIVGIASANTILKSKKTTSIISGGTKLHKYELLTSDGWIEAQVLEADLDDVYTELRLMSSKEGSKKLASISSMVENIGAVAGINGDFFAGSNGIGSSIGLSINEGKIISSSAEENKTQEKFTSLLITENNKALYNYVSDEINIVCESTGNKIVARYINKYTDNTDIPTIYTKDWGDYSIGSTQTLAVTEFVVENAIVKEIRDNQEACEIPTNGFVIMASGIGANSLKENLSVGSKVSYEVVYTPSIDKIYFAVSGGTKLIENGIIPESYSHVISGKNPRTVIGTNKEGNKAYLITIDGRSKSSIGMTLEETSEFLKQIGVYTAINLDGGGSTTMVAKQLGENETEVINNPSGGVQRLVANGVGIISTAPDSNKLYGLEILVEDHNVFVNEERKLKVVGYNKYYNPVEIDEDDIKWDYSGVDVSIKNMTLTGSVVGTSNIVAKIGKISTTCEINILSEANEIVINPKIAAINPGEKITYNLMAKNKNGYYAKTDNNTYKTNVYEYYKNEVKTEIPDDAQFDGLIFTAKTPGTYILQIQKGTCKSYAKVQVGEEKFYLIDDFEKESFTFDPYPDEVGGNATVSTEQKYTGNSSAKLEYDFDRDAKIRGAYIVLNEEAIIPEGATAISFFVYNDDYKNEKLKIKLKDGNNATKLIVIQEDISHEGWQEIRYDISNLVLPLKISDIYVAQDNEKIREKGSIYVDRFGYYANSGIVGEDSIPIPADEKIEDANNLSVNNEKAFNVAILSEIDDSTKMIDMLKISRMLTSINQEADLTIFSNGVSETIKKDYISGFSDTDNVQYGIFEFNKIKTKTLINEKYDLFSNDSCTIICMDISQKGIRLSDETQYSNFETDIKDDDSGNVLIILNGTLDNFTDSRERKLFVDTLCDLKRETGKNIVVVQEGFNQEYSMERGVKFLNIKDTNKDPNDVVKSRYLLISINNKEISYEYKNIF